MYRRGCNNRCRAGAGLFPEIIRRPPVRKHGRVETVGVGHSDDGVVVVVRSRRPGPVLGRTGRRDALVPVAGHHQPAVVRAAVPSTPGQRRRRGRAHVRRPGENNRRRVRGHRRCRAARERPTRGQRDGDARVRGETQAADGSGHGVPTAHRTVSHQPRRTPPAQPHVRSDRRLRSVRQDRRHRFVPELVQEGRRDQVRTVTVPVKTSERIPYSGGFPTSKYSRP